MLRALRALGGDGLLTGFAAGAGGRLIAEPSPQGRASTVRRSCAIDGEARVSTVVLAADGPATRFFEYGPRIGRAEELELLAAVRGRREARLGREAGPACRAAAPGEWAVVDGAAPPGAVRRLLRRALCAALREAGYRVLVDATGEQLAGALRRRPGLVKVNRAEASLGSVDAQDAIERRSGRSPAWPCERLIEARRRRRRRHARQRRRRRAPAAAAHGASRRPVDGRQHDRLRRLSSPRRWCSRSSRDEPVEAALAAAAGAAAANAADPLTGHFDAALARELGGPGVRRPARLARPIASGLQRGVCSALH